MYQYARKVNIITLDSIDIPAMLVVIILSFFLHKLHNQ